MPFLLLQSDGAAAGLFLLLIFGVVGGIMYFVPTIIAISRGHHNALAIGILNLLLGWTFLGWIAALVWSVTATYARPQLHQQHYPQPRLHPNQQRTVEKQPEITGNGFSEWLSEGKNVWKFGAAIFGVIVVIGMGILMPSLERSKQTVALQTTSLSATPERLPARRNLSLELNKKYQTKYQNLSFYVGGADDDIMYVSGSGITEKAINEVKADADSLSRIRNIGMKKLVLKASKRDVTIDL